LNVHASVLAQRLSIQSVTRPIQDVFVEINGRTGYVFLFNHNILEEAKPGTVNLKNASLEQVLDACLAGQPLVYEIDESTVLITRKKTSIKQENDESPQTRSVKGIIQNSNGEPLSNVTVRNTRTGYSTASKDDGGFEISEVLVKDELVFSIVVHSFHQLFVENYDEQRIVLIPEDLDIEEVVVVRYGTQPRESVTSSVAQINKDERMRSH